MSVWLIIATQEYLLIERETDFVNTENNLVVVTREEVGEGD